MRKTHQNVIRLALPCAAALILSLPATAGNVVKTNNTDNLNLGSSWVGGVPPALTDVAVWDNTITAGNTTLLGANLTWAGIKILDPGGLITISAGNTLTLGGSGIDLSLATNSLTLANSNIFGATQTWNVGGGVTLTASGGNSGAGMSLTKMGNGTLVLSAISTYNGGTIINGGTVQANSGTNFGFGAITNNDGTTLRINTTISITNPVVFTGTNTVDLNNVGGNAALNGSWTGSGTVSLVNQNNTAARTFTMGGGGGGGGSMNNFTGTILVGTNTGTFRFNDGGSSQNTGNASATFDLGTTTATFFTRNRNANVSFGALFGAPGTRITQGSSSSGTSTYSIGGKSLPCEFDGTIADGGSSAAVAITKVGSSTLTFLGTNTYVGATTVSAGTLQVGNGGTTGQLGAGAIVNNATLLYNHSDSVTISNAISGSGTLSLQGGGIYTFTGANTSSGTLAVNNGTAVVGASGSIQCPISLAAGASFDVTQNPAFTLNQNLSGSGLVSGPLTAIGGTISPGGSAAAGTLTISNGLAETGNVVHQMEVSSPGGINDVINVIGDLNLSGTNSIVASHFGGGLIPNGTYTLFTYSGNFNGGLSNLAVTVTGVTPTLTNPPNQIAVIITPASRGATNLTWVGDGAANDWDEGISSNWINGSVGFKFQSGDSVRFDSAGAANPTVTLPSPSPLLPAAVVVDAANDYTFTGIGVIGGGTGLTKTNSGSLLVFTTNSYTGPTIVGGGVLEIQNIGNGNAPSAIGASSSDASNLVFFGSTLRYSGPSTSSDRNATLNGAGVTIEVPSGTLTDNGTLTGPAGLIKNGGGTLTLTVPSDYAGGTTISNGVLALGSNNANNSGSQSGVGPTNASVTFYGGTLQLFGYNGSTSPNYNTFRNPLIVPAGQSGTLRLFSRGPANSGANSGLASGLTGAGTLNLVVNYVRDNLDGDWSAFTGTINVTPKPSGSGDEFRINNNFGYSNAVIFLNDGVLMDRVSSANSTIDIGELGGTTGATIGQGNSSAANPNWRVGWKNTSSTFAGTIANDASITKVGTGTFTLTGQSTTTGSITVSNGVVALAPGSNGDGSIGSATINIVAGAFLDVSGRSDAKLPLNSGQTLRGTGTLAGDLDATPGGTVAPGFSIGTLTVTNVATLGGTALMQINRLASPNASKLVAPTINFGGVLQVTNTGPRLQVNDTFDLFDGALSGAFGTLLLPNYYTWDTSNLGINGTIRVTAILPPPAISDISTSAGNVTFNATNGAPNGTIIVLTSTDVTLPVASWTRLATNQFDGSGNFSFTDVVDPATTQRFYSLQAY
jgi:autotransporter-associated beta strand protein